MTRDLIVGLHINNNSRLWPHFAALANSLIEEGAFIVFTASELNDKRVARVMNDVRQKSRCADESGLDTHEFSRLIKDFSLFVTVKNGKVPSLPIPVMEVSEHTPFDMALSAAKKVCKLSN